MLQIHSPATITPMFPTEIYRTEFAGTPIDPLIAQLDQECRRIAGADEAGRAWSKSQGYRGYTSYQSMEDLPAVSPVFAQLRSLLDIHTALFARLLQMDLRNGRLKLGQLWINILDPGGSHGGHIHPHSVCSGTLYVSIPTGTSGLRLEDPRHPMMMHAPLPLPGSVNRQSHVDLTPARGSLVLWESWLRHEVPTNLAEQERISISFNYDL